MTLMLELSAGRPTNSPLKHPLPILLHKFHEPAVFTFEFPLKDISPRWTHGETSIMLNPLKGQGRYQTGQQSLMGVSSNLKRLENCCMEAIKGENKEGLRWKTKGSKAMPSASRFWYYRRISTEENALVILLGYFKAPSTWPKTRMSEFLVQIFADFQEYNCLASWLD